MLHNQSLTDFVNGITLDLNTGQDISAEEIEKIIIPFLLNHPDIIALSLACCGLNDVCAIALSKITTIKSLNVSMNDITSVGVKAIAANTNFTMLSLMCITLNQEATLALGTNQSIKYLNLSASNIGDTEAIALARSQSLIELCIGGQSSFHQAGLKALLSIQTLTDLSLDNREISPEELNILASSDTLKTLNLINVTIGDEGAMILATNNTLTGLYVDCFGMTEKGIKALVSKLNLENLKLTGEITADEAIEKIINERDPIKRVNYGRSVGVSNNSVPSLASIVFFKTENKKTDADSSLVVLGNDSKTPKNNT